MALAQIARGPVHVAQAVEDGAFNSVLGVALKADLFLAVVLHGRVEQADYTGVDQVLEIHMHRKVFIHSDGNRPDEGEVVEHKAVAFAHHGILLDGGGRVLSGLGACRGHWLVPMEGTVCANFLAPVNYIKIS